MKVSSGGKNNPAPYETTHVRVPIPIKRQVELQITEFKRRLENKELVLSGGDIFVQIPLSNADSYKTALQILETFMKESSPIDEASPRNANLRRFRRYLETQIENRM
jgi:hypothetical protein